MKTTFSDYIEAVRVVHASEDFWILDDKFQMIHDNKSNNLLESLQVIHNNEIVGGVLTYLLDHHSTINSSQDIVVIAKDAIATEQLLLLNINQIVDDGAIIGYFLLIQGTVDDFESLNILNLLLHGNNKPSVSSSIELKQREKEILYFISRGRSYREIAESLSDMYHKKIPLSTIASVVRNSLYEKLGVYNMLDLKAKAIELNLINHVPPSLFCRN